MKKILAVSIPLLLLAVLLFILFGAKRNKAEGAFVTAEIQRGDIAVTVTATGTLQAVKTVQVGSQISGTILALYADFNDQVKKGQVLAQLDPTFLKAQVAQAQADLEKATASAELSGRQYERALSLFEKNMISESDRDAALTNYDLARAEIKSSQANLDRLKTNLAYATIASPIDGVIISRDVDVGQTVAASLQAPTLFTIAQDLSKMEVKTSIDEADIGKIADGQKARFTVDAYPELSFEGLVKQVRLSPQVEQNVVSYDVILNVSNPDILLKPGMTANVVIEIDKRENVLKVPAAAFRFRPSGLQSESARALRANSDTSRGRPSSTGGNYQQPDSIRAGRSDRSRVWILDQQNMPEPAQVQAGISDGSFTEIISDNLKEGDKIIIRQEGALQSNGSQEVNPFMPRFGGGRR